MKTPKCEEEVELPEYTVDTLGSGKVAENALGEVQEKAQSGFDQGLNNMKSVIGAMEALGPNVGPDRNIDLGELMPMPGLNNDKTENEKK